MHNFNIGEFQPGNHAMQEADLAFAAFDDLAGQVGKQALQRDDGETTARTDVKNTVFGIGELPNIGCQTKGIRDVDVLHVGKVTFGNEMQRLVPTSE